MIAFVAGIGLTGLLIAAMVRLAIGPTLHDRAMAAYVCLLLATLLVAVIGVLDDRAAWIDAAVALSFADFILGVAVMKAFRARSLQTVLAKRGAIPKVARITEAGA